MTLDLTPNLSRLQNMFRGFLTAMPNILSGVPAFLLFMAHLVKNAVHALAARAGQPRGTALAFGQMASWGVLMLGLVGPPTVIVPTLTAASRFGALGVSGVAIGYAFRDDLSPLHEVQSSPEKPEPRS